MPWRSFRQDIRFIATAAPAVLMACWRRRQGSASQRPPDAGDRRRSLRALRSELAGVAAPGLCAAGADRGKQQRRADLLFAADAAGSTAPVLSDAAGCQFRPCGGDVWPSLSSPGQLGGTGSGAGRRLASSGATLIELVVNETEGTHTLQQLLAQVSRL